MIKQICVNKKANFEYEVLKKYEAGIVLEGSEVKSVRAGGISLTDSYVRVINGEIYLINTYIKPYSQSTSFIPDPRKRRKLLLKSEEIDYISKKVSEKGLTIVPLGVYLKSNLIKVEIGVCKGKKLYDKKASLKEKAVKREIEREIKKI